MARLLAAVVIWGVLEALGGARWLDVQATRQEWAASAPPAGVGGVTAVLAWLFYWGRDG